MTETSETGLAADLDWLAETFDHNSRIAERSSGTAERDRAARIVNELRARLGLPIGVN